MSSLKLTSGRVLPSDESVLKNGIANANVVFITEYSKGKTERIVFHLILQGNNTLH